MFCELFELNKCAVLLVVTLLSTECLSFPHTCNLFGFKQTHLHVLCIHNLDACQSVSLIYSMVRLSVDANVLRRRQTAEKDVLC